MEVDRLLRVDGRKQVERELRQERDEHEWLEHGEHDDRQQHIEQVVRAPVVECDRQELAGIGERLVHDPAR